MPEKSFVAIVHNTVIELQSWCFGDFFILEAV